MIDYFPPQSLTNCKCKTFFGSVAEMKGLESRVVFFLQPVNEQGQQGQPARNATGFSVCALLLLLWAFWSASVCWFGLQVSIFLRAPWPPQPLPQPLPQRLPPPPWTKSLVRKPHAHIKQQQLLTQLQWQELPTLQLGQVIFQVSQVKFSLEIKCGIFPLGDLMLKTFSFMGKIFLILFFICAGVPSEASLSSREKLLYALFGFSSLLFLSIALFVADRVGLRARAHQAWSKIVRIPPKKTQTVLLTLSHYLAVTRSTCGVGFFSTKCM